MRPGPGPPANDLTRAGSGRLFNLALGMSATIALVPFVFAQPCLAKRASLADVRNFRSTRPPAGCRTPNERGASEGKRGAEPAVPLRVE